MTKKLLILLISVALSTCEAATKKNAASRFSIDPKKETEELVPFSFERKSLSDIVDQLAEKKGLNIIPPQKAADLELYKKQVVSYQPHGRLHIPLKESWNLLQTFLDMSGFALAKRNPTLYVVERVGRPDEPGILRETLPIYANTPPDELPDSEERIRYIYYLRNLKVPTTEDKQTNPISRILTEMLTPGTPVTYDTKSNAVIITDKSDVIASVMRIIRELDNSGFRETIEVIALHNVPARDVAKMFDTLKKAAGEAAEKTPFIRSDAKTESLSYFAADTKIIADDRQNTLIIMGRQSAVERIAEFVEDSIDQTPESGKSILHYYDLQYLDAKSFADVLTKVVAPPPAVGFQATVGPSGGPERYFQGVVVMAEEVKTVETKSTTEEVTLEAKGGYLPTGLGAQQIITGGNRLIVAALHDDWLRLKDLIQSLDKPQPQVILEVLIVDITGMKNNIIAGDVRNKTPECSKNGLQFLSSNLSAVNNVLGVSPTELAQDLLGVIAGNTQNPPVTSLLQTGSTVISFNDPRTPGIWALLQILEQVVNAKVLSHPYLVTTNNQKATILTSTIERVMGDAVPSTAGVVSVEIIDLPATLQVQMIPRLSSLERLSLQIAVDANAFISPTSTTRTTRRVNTNANMESGQILVIGGLTQTTQTDLKSGTPILQSIPILGAFFSGKNITVEKTNVAIFICPTIVHPKLRGGMNVYTADKIRKGRRDVDEALVFNEYRDPITRLFFNGAGVSNKVMRDYLSEAINQPDEELIKTTREKRREALRPKKRPKKKLPEEPKKGTVTELPA